MQVQSMHFKARAQQRLADVRLQANLKKLSTKFVAGRANAILELDDFEATRDAAAERRERGLAHLDQWLLRFEREATRRGAKVLWAESAADAARLVVEIARRHGVKKAIKSKSMVSEEMSLNSALQAADVQVVETDLGEYILQINGNEPPSHIIAPVVHKDKDEIADLFSRVHARKRKTDIAEMTREAREILRTHFLQADMGITGGNFVIAETG
ncbi:MAG TPA: LUD domain-containing protein, partial [Burkholderiaceae bacterium]|nr:LUD domain-containing protein [Burkholderiaceae bacterium]